MNVRLIVPNCNSTASGIAYGKAIAGIAGGFTATQAIGGWIDDSGTLVVEAVTVFDCWLNEEAGLVDFPRDSFHALARRIARELHQQTVYLEINGWAEFVKSNS